MSVQEPEELHKCPYNPCHRIRISRFQRHIYKCARQHPHIELEQCPYDISHFLDPHEMKLHKQTCPEKWKFDKYLLEFTSTINDNKENFPKINLPKVNYEENWDHYNVKTYDPQEHCMENPILRSCNGKTKKERREFYEKENERITEIEKTLPR